MRHDTNCPVCGGPIPKQPITILPERGMVVANGKFAMLTGSEIAVIEILAEKFPCVVTKETMMDHLYGNRTDEPSMKIVDVFVCKVRKKLSKVGVEIETSWGNGYFLGVPVAPEIVRETVA